MLKFRESGLSVLRNAQHIISTYEKFQPSLEKWIEYICEHIFESFNLFFMSDLKKELLFSTLKNNIKDTLLVQWRICDIELSKLSNFFCNQLIVAMLNNMLKYRNRKLIPICTPHQNVHLENSEIETLCYIAGYIVFTL